MQWIVEFRGFSYTGVMTCRIPASILHSQYNPQKDGFLGALRLDLCGLPSMHGETSQTQEKNHE
jgi:hypothetical protein